VILPITIGDYVNMASDASIKAYFKAKVKETGQVFCDVDTMEFIKPALQANVSVRTRFQNPAVYKNNTT
jgi:hypothetical protein